MALVRSAVRHRLGLLLLLAWSCGSPTEPREPTIALIVSADSGASVTDPMAHVSGVGQVAVVGVIATPCEPYGANATLVRNGGQITLTITGYPVNGCPSDVIGALRYEVMIARLPARAYDLRVVHSYPGTAWRVDTALTQSLTVP